MTGSSNYPVANSAAGVPGSVLMTLDAAGAAQPASTYSVYHLASAAGTNAHVVKASLGRVTGWYVSNTSASWRYVRVYNLATTPVVGTSAPMQVIGIPPNTAVDVEFAWGIAYPIGIAIAITGGAADLDATAVAANDVLLDVFYI